MKGFTREMERKERIQKIRLTIEAIKSQDLEFEEDKFIFEIMGNYGVTEKVASDYLRVAKALTR